MFAEDLSKSNDSPLQKVARWEDQVVEDLPPIPLRPIEPGYQFSHYMRAGLWQGALAGCVSLVLNIIGSVLWPTTDGAAQHPLRLIEVFLTFPFGARALELESGGGLLALGCLLYVVTGMLYGMLFVLVLSYFLPNADLRGRLVACSVMAIAVWAVNFYGILLWLQPWLFGGAWIMELIPWWVAATTHLAFGWTIALIYPLAGKTLDERKE